MGTKRSRHRLRSFSASTGLSQDAVLIYLWRTLWWQMYGVICTFFAQVFRQTGLASISGTAISDCPLRSGYVRCCYSGHRRRNLGHCRRMRSSRMLTLHCNAPSERESDHGIIFILPMTFAAFRQVNSQCIWRTYSFSSRRSQYGARCAYLTEL